MKRHICRHCGLAFDTYAELRHHVKSHSTPSWDQYTYSVAPQAAAVPPSDHAKRAKYPCKCDATFGSWDDLEHHVMSVCRLRRRSSSCSRKKHHRLHVHEMWTEFRKTLGADQTRTNRVYRHHRAAIAEEIKYGRNPPTTTHSLPKKIPLNHPLDFTSPTLCRRNC